ncbi:MAG: fibronectin type III domain-containing protein [Bacteroidia bacterium]|nr:fibronectin type III domain-containing protein [Bacteroidia bacterium]
MRTISLFAVLSLFLLNACGENDNSSLRIIQLKCNGIENPAGTDRIPDFSWIMDSEERGQKQTAYQIIVSSEKRSAAKLEGDLWDSGKITSGNNARISYGGKELQPGTEYYWRIRVWDKKDNPSDWSETGNFIT